MSRALALVALTHLRYMHSEHHFMLELASSPLVKLPCSPQRTIQAFGRCAGKGWLLEVGGQRQRRQHFCTLQMVGGLRAVSVSSSSELDEAPQPRLSCSAVQALLVAARSQLRADLMRDVLKEFAWLEALPLPTLRTWHRSVECT